MTIKRKEASICLVGYLAGALTWLITILLWFGLSRKGALHDPLLWYDSLHTLAFETYYGDEFLVVTLHSWGSIFAVVALAWTRRRTQPLVTISGLLLLVVCFSLLLSSVQWFHAETGPFFARYYNFASGRGTAKSAMHKYDYYLYRFRCLVFRSPMDYRAFLLGTLAFLGVLAIWWKGSAPATPRGQGEALPIRARLERLRSQLSKALVPAFAGSLALSLILALALVVQHRRIVVREEAIARRDSAMQAEVFDRFRKISQENAFLKYRVEELQIYARREKVL